MFSERLVDIEQETTLAFLAETVVEAHDIASETERALAKKFGTVIANIHIEPYLGQQVRPNGSCLD